MLSDSKIIHLPTFLVAVLMLSSIGLVTTDVYLPSLPFIQADFLTTPYLVQLTLSFYLISFSLSQLIYGPISDRVGRRKTVLFGLVISLVGTLVCEFSSTITILILGRFLQGLGLGAGAALSRSIRRDVHSGDDLARFGSFVIIGTSIMFAIAPALGGYIQQYVGWRGNFFFMSVYILFNILFILFFLPETIVKFNSSATKVKNVLNNYFFLVKSPVFMGYSLCSSLAFAGLTAYLTVSPFIFEKVMGLMPIEYGRLGLIIAGGLGIGGYFNKLAIKPLGRKKMLTIGTISIFLSGALMLLLGLMHLLNLWAIMLPMFIYTFGAGITFTNSFAGAFHPFAKIAGFTGALFGCLQILGGFVSSIVLAQFQQNNQILLSVLLTVVGISAYFFQKLASWFSSR